MEIENIFRILELITSVGIGFAIYRATINGPSRAVQDQKDREERENRENKKLDIFSRLMSTRVDRLSDRHIEALNMIDIVYSDANEVIYAWSEYYDILNKTEDPNSSNQQLKSERDKLFVDLLHQISQSLGFSYTKLDVKNRCYRPVDHFHRDLDERDIREGLAHLLSHRRSLLVDISGTNNLFSTNKISEPIPNKLSNITKQENDE
jgi:hypothetical protein